MKPISRDRTTGMVLAGITAVVSGVAVFVNGYGVRAWTGSGVSSGTYTTAKNVVAAVLLAGVLGLATRRRSSEGLSRPGSVRQWAGLAAVAVVGGSVPFLLFFEGLSRASSVQAAFIHKTLVVWVAVLAVPLLKEKVTGVHLAAIGVLLAGQAILVGGVGDLAFGSGEVMILGATLLWSVEVIVAKRLLGSLSSLTVACARMGGGAVVLITFGLTTGAFAGLGALGVAAWLWVAVTGLVLSLYVGSWYLALARAPAIDVTAVLVFGAVVTAVLRTAVDGAALGSPLGLGLVTAGSMLAFVALRRRVSMP